jgi:hypothetical protein
MIELRELIQKRRMDAGPGGQPLGWLKFGGTLKVSGPLLNMFHRGQRQLGISTIRNLAKWANDNNDNELIFALARYALDIELPRKGIEVPGRAVSFDIRKVPVLDE